MNRLVPLALAAALLAPPAALAQPAAGPQASAPQAAAPKTYDMRDDASEWIKDPNIHAFYQAAVDAFAQGPDHVDRPAFEKRSQDIFRALAVAHHMPPDALLDHLKAIPGEVVLIATRDPKTLDSYDNFVVALFGPQTWAPAPVAQK